MEELFNKWKSSSWNVIGYNTYNFASFPWVMDFDRLTSLLAVLPFVSDAAHAKRQRCVADCAREKALTLRGDSETRAIAQEYVKRYNSANTKAKLPLTDEVIERTTMIVVLLQMATNDELNPRLDALSKEPAGWSAPVETLEQADTT